MVKSGELNHEYFEELCALAALGQISQGEYEELLPHLRSCTGCRVRHFEFMEILHEHLPLLDPQKELFADSPNISFHDSSYKQRFIRRAQKQGIEFTDSDPGAAAKDHRQIAPRNSRRWIGEMFWHPSFQKYALLLTAVVFGLAIGWMGQRLRGGRLGSADSLVEITRLENELAGLHQRIRELSVSQMSSKTRRASPDPKMASSIDSSYSDSLQAELSVARNSYAAEVVRSRSLEEQLQKTSSELVSLREELTALQGKTQGGDKLHETELALGQATEALEKLNRARALDTSALAAQQVHIRELTEKLNNQGGNLDRERELLVAGRDIRDLMGARSLHIIDVADVDNQGTKRPFGRVFYTEGKSLIFYAYDLERKKKPQERYSFQAWGQRESKSGSAQSLGIFFVDDQTQNRWILKYDDPNVLAEIDAVFVTLEPKGGSPKPKGQQLMYAYLKANPNHP
jgi:hypothetical protein